MGMHDFLRVGFATRIEGNMDATLYKEILEDERERTNRVLRN